MDPYPLANPPGRDGPMPPVGSTRGASRAWHCPHRRAPRSEWAEKVWFILQGTAMCFALPTFLLLAAWGIKLFETHASGPIRTIIIWTFVALVGLLGLMCLCGQRDVDCHGPRPQ